MALKVINLTTFQGAVLQAAGGRDSVVGTGTLYRLDCPGFNPGGRFSVPIQTDPEAQPASSYTMDRKSLSRR